MRSLVLPGDARLICLSYASLHFHRPSNVKMLESGRTFHSLANPGPYEEELHILKLLRETAERFATEPLSVDNSIQGLIPQHLQVGLMDYDISLSSARLYLALHPLFSMSELGVRSILDQYSSQLFNVIARSSTQLIDHFAALSDGNKILSIWMAAEQVLEAGAVWAAYLMSRHQNPSLTQHGASTMGTRAGLSPILKVTSLLTSFAVRCKDTSAHLRVWETLVALLWNML